MVIKPPPSEVMSVSIPITDLSCAAEARRVAAGLARMLGLSDADTGRVALVVTEAATNICQHAQRGEVVIRSLAADAAAGIEVLALDRGPGIANIAQSLIDGYSTQDSLGTGLGAIKRQSTEFDIYSTPQNGTAILSRIMAGNRIQPAPSPGHLRWGVICIAHPEEDVCGDAWIVRDSNEESMLMVVDGVGHGIHAFNASGLALDVFSEHAVEGPQATLYQLNETLKPTRGAVALLCQFHWDARILSTLGFGNIAARLLSADGSSQGIVSHPGTLGQAMQPAPGGRAEIDRARLHTTDWPEDALLIIHSDGMSSRWNLNDYPGLYWRDPTLIAGVLYRDFCARKDDVIILVCREQPTPPYST